jgi:hypothetical protein
MPESGAPPLSSPALSGAVVDGALVVESSVVVTVWASVDWVAEPLGAGLVEVVFSSSLPQAPRARTAAAAEIAIARLIAPMIANLAARHGNFARKLGASCLMPASVLSGTIPRVDHPSPAAADHSRRHA